MEEKQVKKDFEHILEALSDSFEREADQKHAEWTREVIKEHSYLDINKPEMFSLLMFNTLKEQERALIKTVLSHKNLSKEIKHKVEFAYLKYEFISCHLRKIIWDYESGGCSADKTRWLIDTYVEYIINGKVPEIEERKYWHPECGEITQWLIWIDSMDDLYYGEVERYVLAKYELINCYKNNRKE